MPRDLVHACRELDRLQDLLLILRLDVHVGSGEIGESGGGGGRLKQRDELRRHLWKQLDGFDGLSLQVDESRLDLGRACRGFRNVQNARGEKRRTRKKIENAGALYSLADDVVSVIRRGDVTHDIGNRANPIELVGTGIVRLGVSLK